MLKIKTSLLGLFLSEKRAYCLFLTEPVDLGNGIKGFVGLAANGVNKEGRKTGFQIEEKFAQAIGFGELVNRRLLSQAKERLSALKKKI